MEQTILSNIELYFTDKQNIQSNNLVITGDDAHHIVKVMRHKKGDEIYITNGFGHIYLVKISEIMRNELTAWIIRPFYYENILKNIIVCMPVLRNQDRLEFAIEKCVELGITNIMIFEGKRSVAKGIKLARWQKLALAAMKQSIRCYLPNIEELQSLSELNKFNGKKIIFEQTSENSFINFLLKETVQSTQRYYLIFGPEGGLVEEEINILKDKEYFHLTTNRLRAETAIISAVSVLVTSLK